MKIAVLATQIPYRQHIQPVWDALTDDEQGPYVERADTLVHKRADLWLTAAYRDFQRVRNLRAKTVLMEHGCGLQWFAPHVLEKVKRADLIAAPNEFIGDRYAALGAHVEVVGTPKMDALVDIPTPGDGTVAISWHWTSMRQHPTVMQTYRDAIAELASVHHVIGHAHPRVFFRLVPYWKKLGIEPVEDFAEVVRRADVYCCEHSSTLYEWAALDRPVVLLHRSGGRKVIPQASGLRYSLHADIGLEARPETLITTVDKALTDDGRADARRAATEELFPYLGESTQRMVELLRSM